MILNWHLFFFKLSEKSGAECVNLPTKKSCIRDEAAQRGRNNLRADLVKSNPLFDLTVVILGFSGFFPEIFVGFFAQN